ncbi:MAG TPA: peptidoglycan editing factor PgeF [Polyangiales bacterium]|jgi:hypothetical protein|nr:peptidoglycan editing factor PgeF [Polyangiales bacterium]
MTCVVQSPLLLQHGFSHGFSLRTGGVSAAPFDSLNLGRAVGDDAQSVAQNHQRMAQAVGYADGALFELSQVHGKRVREVHANESPVAVRREEGDGLFAREPGLTVGVRAADCLPLALVDPESGAVAAVHAGWRGAVAGIALEAVSALTRELGVPAARLRAAVFPHIRVCCFEVGAEVVQEIAAAGQNVRAPAELIDESRARPYASLVTLIRAQLTAAGLLGENVDDVPGCTRCEPERFFSYRRDGQRSGRHLLAVVARERRADP